MISSYFTITFRNLLKNRSYAFINILGLSIGITCCIIIYLLITHEIRFDRFHTKSDHIFRVVRTTENASGEEQSSVTPYPFARAFRNDFPDIPLVTQMHNHDEATITIGPDKQKLENVLFADSLFFRVFDFEIVSGNPQAELGKPNKVFLTESLAKTLFRDGLFQPIKIDNVAELEVVGIIKDSPPESHIQYSMIVSMPTLSEKLLGLPVDQWGNNSSGYSYVVLPEGYDAANVEHRFQSFVRKYYGEKELQTYLLQPLKEVHFDKRFDSQAIERSDLIILAMLGLFILGIACINFVNLSTALAVKKSKEIGVRKTLGAARSQLTLYFLSETFVLTLTSVIISLGLVEWLLPWLNSFTEKRLSQDLGSDFQLLLFLLAILVVVTILSGLYPASILSSYNPVHVLKNKIASQTPSGIPVRKVLVVFQFLIAQALIAATLIVSDQMSYFRSKPLGFTKEAIINVDMPAHDARLLQSFTSRLEANPDIRSVTYSFGAPVSDNGFGTTFRMSEGDPDQSYDVNLKIGDDRYGETYGLTLIAGRWITEADEKLADEPLPWDERKYVLVVNESAMKQLGFNQPDEIIGKNITVGVNNISAPVVGVVKDFHTSSLHQSIKPVIIMNFPYFYYDAGVKIQTDNLQETVAFIKKVWTDLNPDYYFEYSFLDQHLEGLYRKEARTFTLFKIFAGVSIFIACLGLYGLISFMATQKLKEVGIRKVFGASVMSIVALFSKEFVRLIAIAFVVAAPLSWYFMSRWLETFAYRTTIDWKVFAIAIGGTIVIALATVSYRAIKAAFTNPASTLRSE